MHFGLWMKHLITSCGTQQACKDPFGTLVPITFNDRVIPEFPAVILLQAGLM
jgi:hypothetical protein